MIGSIGVSGKTKWDVLDGVIRRLFKVSCTKFPDTKFHICFILHAFLSFNNVDFAFPTSLSNSKESFLVVLCDINNSYCPFQKS